MENLSVENKNLGRRCLLNYMKMKKLIRINQVVPRKSIPREFYMENINFWAIYVEKSAIKYPQKQAHDTSKRVQENTKIL